LIEKRRRGRDPGSRLADEEKFGGGREIGERDFERKIGF
jgi:hypothetical protein